MPKEPGRGILEESVLKGILLEESNAHNQLAVAFRVLCHRGEYSHFKRSRPGKTNDGETRGKRRRALLKATVPLASSINRNEERTAWCLRGVPTKLASTRITCTRVPRRRVNSGRNLSPRREHREIRHSKCRLKGDNSG